MNEVLGTAVHEVKVVAGLVTMGRSAVLPIEAQPLHRIDDGVDVTLIFFFWIGVVKTQVANTAVILRQTKVQANAFGVSDVQVSVGLRRKAGTDFGGIWRAFLMRVEISRRAAPAPLRVGALGQIGFNDLAQKITGLIGISVGFIGLGHERQSVEVNRGCAAIRAPPRHCMKASPAFCGRRFVS